MKENRAIAAPNVVTKDVTTAEPFALARRGLPLPTPSRTPLRAPWLPASLRSRAQPAPARAAVVAPVNESEIATPADEPWWMEAAQWDVVADVASKEKTAREVIPGAEIAEAARTSVAAVSDAAPASEVALDAQAPRWHADGISTTSMGLSSHAFVPRAATQLNETVETEALASASSSASSPARTQSLHIQAEAEEQLSAHGSQRTQAAQLAQPAQPSQSQPRTEKHGAAIYALASEGSRADAALLNPTRALQAHSITPATTTMTTTEDKKNIDAAPMRAPQMKPEPARELTDSFTGSFTGSFTSSLTRSFMGASPQDPARATQARPTTDSSPALPQLHQRQEALNALATLNALNAFNAAEKASTSGVRIDEVTLSVNVTPASAAPSLAAPAVQAAPHAAQIAHAAHAAARPYRSAWSSYFARRD